MLKRYGPCAGFTLLETALALVIMALVVSAMIYPLRTQVETRFVDETQKTLDEAREALLGFISVNGYFPCPADAASNGQEAVGTDHDLGTCPTWYGFLPAAALGMSKLDLQGYAIDAWGLPGDATGLNRIRYAVTNQTVQTIPNAYTSENALASIDIDLIDSIDLLYVCGSGTGVVAGSNCGTAPVLTTRAPVVIWSVVGMPAAAAPTPTKRKIRIQTAAAPTAFSSAARGPTQAPPNSTISSRGFRSRRS
jgi:type II secretory pathway pseudopilin PulG